jgi:XTP/dITP diphosphohydrolase
MISELVLGTHNQKKLRELQQLVSHYAIMVRSLTEYPDAIVVPETGTTFVENARLKATVQAMHLQRWVLAEDSGLSVAALNGRPGVYSARYAGDDATDEANNHLLLHELAAVPEDKRAAWYTCQICLASPQGKVVFEATGQCHGRIALSAQGDHGFGYDPLFVVAEYHRTFGQLGPRVKQAISHRARAMRYLQSQLTQLLAVH